MVTRKGIGQKDRKGRQQFCEVAIIRQISCEKIIVRLQFVSCEKLKLEIERSCFVKQKFSWN